MTIEEAIKHCYDNAMEQRLKGCDQCSKEHFQLGIWLEELVELRAIYEGLNK